MMMNDDKRRAPEYISKQAGFTPGGAVGEVVFRIRVFDNAVIGGKATVLTTRAGILEARAFVISSP